jgi:Tfp pilus assembly protein PilX
MLSPNDISQQLTELVNENYRGVNAVYQAEAKLAQAEYDLDTAEQTAFISAEGSVAERTAIAKLNSAEKRLERDLARAEFNRVKLKLKAIESALMASATQAKLLSVEIRL